MSQVSHIPDIFVKPLASNIIGVLEALPKPPINTIVIRIKPPSILQNSLEHGWISTTFLASQTHIGFWVRLFWLVSNSKFSYKLHPSNMKSDSSKRVVLSIFHQIDSDQT